VGRGGGGGTPHQRGSGGGKLLHLTVPASSTRAFFSPRKRVEKRGKRCSVGPIHLPPVSERNDAALERRASLKGGPVPHLSASSTRVRRSLVSALPPHKFTNTAPPFPFPGLPTNPSPPTPSKAPWTPPSSSPSPSRWWRSRSRWRC
jgi:hypothetical protein